MNDVANIAERHVAAALQGFPIEVTVKDDGQCRRVGIFGVTLEVDRTAREVVLVRDPLDQIVLNWGLSEGPRERLVCLLFPFSLSFVLELLQEHLRRESASLTAGADCLSAAGTHPAASEFIRHSVHVLAGVLDLQRVNQQVFRELQLDERILQAADLASGGWPVGSDCYNQIWGDWECYGVVLDDAPNLMPLAHSTVVNGHIAGSPEILRELKDALRRAGLSKSGWQQLCGLSRNMVHVLIPSFEREFFECLVNASRNFAILEQEGPMGFASSLLKLPGHVEGSLHELSPQVTRLLASQAHLHAARGRLANFFDNDLYLVCKYLRKSQPRPATLRGSKWSRLVSAARRYNEEDEEEMELSLPETEVKTGPASWDTAVGEYREAGFLLVPLTTSASLAEEGSVMHHCVGRYVSDCVSGKSRIFSIRSLRTKRRVATVELHTDDLKSRNRWVVNQAKGAGNAKVNDRVKAVAHGLARRYNKVSLQSASSLSD